MKKVVLTFGLIAGAIVVGLMFLTMPLVDVMDESTMTRGMIIGYTTMVISLATIFFGIKVYRDKYNGGSIKFGKGFLIGLYISLIATTMYAFGWEGFMIANGSNPQEFAEQYAAGQMKILEESNATAEEIKTKSAEMKNMMEMYGNPLFRFFMTMLEMLPVGIIVSVICALILKNNKVLPAKA